MNKQEINQKIKKKIAVLNGQIDDTFKNNFDEWMLIFTILFSLQHHNADLSNLIIYYKNMKKLTKNNHNGYYNDIISHIIKESSQQNKEDIKKYFEKIKTKTCFYELLPETTKILDDIQRSLESSIRIKIEYFQAVVKDRTIVPKFNGNIFTYLNLLINVLEHLITRTTKIKILNTDTKKRISEYKNSEKIEYEIIKNILYFKDTDDDKNIMTKTITLMQQNKTLPHLKEFKLIIEKMLSSCKNDNNGYFFMLLDKLLPNIKTNVYNKTDINTAKIQQIITTIGEAKIRIKIVKTGFIKKHPYNNKPLHVLKQLITNEHDIKKRTYIALEIMKQLLSNDNIDPTILNEIIKYTNIVCEYGEISELTMKIIKLLQEIVTDKSNIDTLINNQECLKHIQNHENIENEYTTETESLENITLSPTEEGTEDENKYITKTTSSENITLSPTEKDTDNTEDKYTTETISSDDKDYKNTEKQLNSDSIVVYKNPTLNFGKHCKKNKK
jgi:hypothetical protein